MTVKDIDYMKTLDVIAAGLLFIGGINWGLIGLFGFDLIASVFGSMSIITRVIYLLVAAGAVYDGLMWKSIKKRWECRGEFLSGAGRAAA